MKEHFMEEAVIGLIFSLTETGEGPGLLSSGAASGHTRGSPGLSGRLSEGSGPVVRLPCQRRDSTTFLTELRMSMVLADMGLLAQRHREARRRTCPPAPWSLPTGAGGRPCNELS